MSKLVPSLEEAIRAAGLRDGMTISFHHHLRGGDHVLNMVMDTIARMGIRDLTINASSIHESHAPLVEHMKSGVVTGLETNYVSASVGYAVSAGVLPKPMVFRTHGGRPSDIISGKSHIDVAFIGAPTSDNMGNCTGKTGPAACGSLGYAIPDAQHADKVVVITDHLVSYPLAEFSIPETCVDYVVTVDSIGDPAGIVSGTTRITRDPVSLKIADWAAKCIRASGLLKEGFSFQTGAGGASLAAAAYLKDVMLAEKIRGSYMMGGITGYMVDMMNAGCFESILDVQCFDLTAVESIRTNPRHREISADQYASPTAKSCAVDGLDVVILGATEIDRNFNVNVHTDSNSRIMGGSGGHSDTAAGAKMAMIVAPLVRARIPIVTEQVQCVSTPGSTVDVLVTQRGIAVNPARQDLRDRFRDAKLPVVEIDELLAKAAEMVGPYKPVETGDRVVAEVLYRDGTLLDTIRQVQ